MVKAQMAVFLHLLSSAMGPGDIYATFKDKNSYKAAKQRAGRSSARASWVWRLDNDPVHHPYCCLQTQKSTFYFQTFSAALGLFNAFFLKEIRQKVQERKELTADIWSQPSVVTLHVCSLISPSRGWQNYLLHQSWGWANPPSQRTPFHTANPTVAKETQPIMLE